MDDDAGTGPQRGHYQFDLDCRVETCIDEYEQDMTDWYAKGGPTDPELSAAIFEQAKRFADHVLKAADQLVPPKPTDCALVELELKQFIDQFEAYLAELAAIVEQKGLSPDAFLTAFRGMASDTRPEDGTILKIVWELLLIRSMGDAVERARKVATRLLLLSPLRVPLNPTKRTRAFLKQAVQCFVWGFNVPCIVFCRSVIDVTLKDAGIRNGSLQQRINNAPAQLLDAEGKSYAHEVRCLCNDAIHDKPLAMKDVLDVIRKTLIVLQQITQGAPPE
ncbi:MAG TPA: DUF4145 domain-containing protein [Phycisphaerae bacterium]|nr:DUF4145 domain-containing protein [Phycisphaerae bacterium]